MSYVARFTICFNLIGLALVTAAENWRPGAVTSSLNLGLLWLGSACLCAFATWWDRRSMEPPTT